MSRNCLIRIGVAVFALLSVAVSLNSLRRPAWMIEASLLRMTPLGTPKEEVLRAVEKQGWRHDGIRDVGFVRQAPPRPMEVVGKKSMQAHVGDYGLILRTSVDAFWGFDEKGQLTDVWIWKTTDAP